MVDENKYYLGISIGSDSTSISYINNTGQNTKSIEAHVMDRSGGFGQTSVPTTMAYIVDEGQWLIGQEAVEASVEPSVIYVKSVLELIDMRSGKRQDDVLDILKGLGLVMDGVALLTIYIIELSNFIVEINPKASIDTLAISLADDLHALVEKQLLEQLDKGTFVSEVTNIKVVAETESFVAYVSMTYDQGNNLSQYIKVVDFGHEAFRCYNIILRDQWHVESITNTSDLSGQDINNVIRGYFINIYKEHKGIDQITDQEVSYIRQMVNTYYPYIFRSYKEKKGFKVTYNFAYPPFQSYVDAKKVLSWIDPYVVHLREILSNAKSMDEHPIVFAVGNGLRMDWAMTCLREIQHKEIITQWDASAKGTAYLAYIGTLSKTIVKKGGLDADYGLVDANNHFHILEAVNTPLESMRQRLFVTLQESIDGKLALYKRDGTGQIELVESLEYIPSREEVYAENQGIVNVALSLKLSQDMTPTLDIEEVDL